MKRALVMKAKSFFSFIKFSHSIFALPFALASMLVAANGIPSLKIVLLIVAAMVCARTAAMAFNRWADAEIDANNPRTKVREIPQGKISKRFALNVTILSSFLFIGTTFFLNHLCFLLSPAALFILLFYSYTKRFTSLAHLFVGLALGISPVGAWIAVTGDFALAPIILGVAVLFWVSGFDLMYACQDIEFDKKARLHSLPLVFGIADSLFVAKMFHVFTFMLFLLFGIMLGLQAVYFAVLLPIGLFLMCEHSIVKPNDLSRINPAFFTANGVIAILYLVGTGLSVLL